MTLRAYYSQLLTKYKSNVLASDRNQGWEVFKACEKQLGTVLLVWIKGALFSSLIALKLSSFSDLFDTKLKRQ